MFEKVGNLNRLTYEQNLNSWAKDPYYWTFLKKGGKRPIFVFSHDMIINASPALTQI